MGLSESEIREVLAEIGPDLTGSHVQKITQPAPDRVCIKLRRPGRTLHLLLVCDPDHSRLHLVETAPRPPASAPTFCMTLRKHLGGARLHDIVQTPGDRVVTMTFTRGPDENDALRLVAELFGRGSNLLLIDAADRILAAQKPRPDGARPMIPGVGYLAPASATGRPAGPAPRQSEAAAPPRSETPSSGSDEALAQSFPYPLSMRLAATHAEAEQARAVDNQRRTLATAIRRARKKLDARAAKVERERVGLGTAAEYKQLGELIKANLGPLGNPNRRGLDSVEVVDWTADGAPTVRVPLNPKRTLIENMESYFGRARKADRAAARIAEHLDWIGREIAALADLDTRLGEAETLDDFEPIAAGIRTHSGSTRDAARGRSAAGQAPAAGPKRFVSKDGIEILVGRNARDNDTLTFRIARGNDYWFHVQDHPGSHVVVRVGRDQPLPPETMLDAALLAMHHSEASDHGSATVQYTQRKHLRKPKGAAPGQVLVAARKTVFLRPDARRLERLIGAPGPFSPGSTSTAGRAASRPSEDSGPSR